jgi:hypothetical protein
LASGMAVSIGAEYGCGIHEMLLLAVRGSVPRGVCRDPHFHYKCASPRFRAALPTAWIRVRNPHFTFRGSQMAFLQELAEDIRCGRAPVVASGRSLPLCP